MWFWGNFILLRRHGKSGKSLLYCCRASLNLIAVSLDNCMNGNNGSTVSVLRDMKVLLYGKPPSENKSELLNEKHYTKGEWVKKIPECCILKGNWGNRWPLEDVRIPWICLISQNKNTDSFLFSQKQQLFLNFWKKNENFIKIWWFCQKCKAIKIYFFCEKKTLFRNRICHKILKISSKIRQIRDLQRRTTSKNQCECFFRFFLFSKTKLTILR